MKMPSSIVLNSYSNKIAKHVIPHTILLSSLPQCIRSFITSAEPAFPHFKSRQNPQKDQATKQSSKALFSCFHNAPVHSWWPQKSVGILYFLCCTTNPSSSFPLSASSVKWAARKEERTTQDTIFLKHYPKAYWNLVKWKCFGGKQYWAKIKKQSCDLSYLTTKS